MAMTTPRHQYKIGEIIFCPNSEALYKIIGYSKDGIPITQVVDGQTIDEEEVAEKESGHHHGHPTK